MHREGHLGIVLIVGPSLAEEGSSTEKLEQGDEFNQPGGGRVQPEATVLIHVSRSLKVTKRFSFLCLKGKITWWPDIVDLFE